MVFVLICCGEGDGDESLLLGCRPDTFGVLGTQIEYDEPLTPNPGVGHVLLAKRQPNLS